MNKKKGIKKTEIVSILVLISQNAHKLQIKILMMIVARLKIGFDNSNFVCNLQLEFVPMLLLFTFTLFFLFSPCSLFIQFFYFSNFVCSIEMNTFYS